MAPWFARNLRVIGRPLSTAGLQTLWLTDYDDLFSYGKPLTLRAYLDWGWDNILRSKLQALWLNAQTVLFVGWMIALAPLGLLGAWRLRRQAAFRLAGLYGVLLYLTMSLVFTFPGWRGGMLHSTVALLPALYAAAMEGLDLFVDLDGPPAPHLAAGAGQASLERRADPPGLGLERLALYNQPGSFPRPPPLRSGCRLDGPERARTTHGLWSTTPPRSTITAAWPACPFPTRTWTPYWT